MDFNPKSNNIFYSEHLDIFMIQPSRSISLLIVFIALVLTACTKTQTQNAKTLLSVQEFSQQIGKMSTPQIVDVRTPNEFLGGHLINAVNVDVNGDNFEQSIQAFDKSKPTFVYCLSGGRSASAAALMRNAGFKEVYEMDGGMMSWRNAGLPETTNSTVSSSGMSLAEFKAKLVSDKLVLVDFYAEWCNPCKKMKPFLEEIEKEYSSSLILLRIDVDANPALAKELGIDGIPYFKLYNNQTEQWNHMGFIDKENLISSIQSVRKQ